MPHQSFFYTQHGKLYYKNAYIVHIQMDFKSLTLPEVEIIFQIFTKKKKRINRRFIDKEAREVIY